MEYTVHYELATDETHVLVSEMIVEAVSEERALEYASGILDQQYDDATLLVCEVVK